MDNYTIKEFISHVMNDINGKINEIHSIVKKIEDQTTKTNGRVSKLEWWRSGVVWAIGILWTFLLLLIPYLIRFIGNINKLDTTVSNLTEDYSIER